VTRLGPCRIAAEAVILAAVITGLAAWRYPAGPRVLLGAMYGVAASRMLLPRSHAADRLWMALVYAVTSALAAVQWWPGEPARLRVAGAVFYGACAVVCAVWDVALLRLRRKEPAS
jgi:hypothetical protein